MAAPVDTGSISIGLSASLRDAFFLSQAHSCALWCNLKSADLNVPELGIRCGSFQRSKFLFRFGADVFSSSSAYMLDVLTLSFRASLLSPLFIIWATFLSRSRAVLWPMVTAMTR